jgi:hypothetical protein
MVPERKPEAKDAGKKSKAEPAEKAGEAEPAKGAEVVSLDAFRKK